MAASRSPYLEAADASEPDVELPSETANVASVQWCDLSFSVGEAKILNNISGELRPGQLVCILGPSGAGKSTLLNVLAGRQRTSGEGYSMSGAIEMGDQLMTPEQMKKRVAFVMQDEALMPTQTVKESLLFSAALKLPHQSASQRSANVDVLLKNLGLDSCKDTIIGSALVKGVSGGERKRTSVGVELITNPSVVLLDEPTSGLDSFAASELIKELKKLAQKGCIVCCTIHQPSSEVFSMFDHVMCLRKGEMFFQGPNSELLDICEQAGFPCPSGYNAADWILFLAQTTGYEDCKRIQEKSFLKMTSNPDSRMGDLHRRITGGEVTTPSHATKGLPVEVPRARFGTQITYLIKREFQNVKRDKKSLGARMGMTVGQAILYALIFPGAAKDNDPSKNFNVFGALVGLCIAGFFGAAQPLLLSFPLERPVFLREYSSNMYSCIAYFVSKTIVEVVVTFVQVSVLFAITFWVMGFTTGFVGFLESIFAVWLMAIAAGSMALWVGCIVSTPSSAVQLAPAISVPQILFSGLFVQTKDLPIYLQWVQYICALKYGINLLSIIEFGGGNRIGGDSLLEMQNIEEDWYYIYVVIQLCIFAGFRVFALISLQRKGKYVF